MKLHIFFILALLFSGAVFYPATSNAYFTSNQSALDLGNGKALYTITYSFGLKNRDVVIPISATRDATTSVSDIGYSFTHEGYTRGAGNSSAIVLSKATIKDNQYFVPKGTASTFTLVSILDMSLIKIASASTSLQVTSLPFTLIENGVSYPNKLNKTELDYYKTPAVVLP